MKYAIYILSIALFLLLSGRTTFAQTIAFAEDIKPDGQMIGQNASFTIAKGGGTIKMLVTLKGKVNSTKVVYKVYRLDAKGNKYLDQTINDNVERQWLWFFTELFIRSPGIYLVELYSEGKKTVIASGKVKII